MKAITIRKAGLIELENDRRLPPLSPELVRVRVKYAGVGFADVMAIRGGYPLAPKRPFSPGYEFYGRIEESGDSAKASGIAPLETGQRVAGMLPRMGAYRELIDVEPRFVVPVHPGLSDEAAALLPLNYLTALAMIERCARLEKGRSFLIHGAAGGVGTAALELARKLGLRAYGSASAHKRDLIASLGGIPLSREGNAWIDELRNLEGGGVDAAFDSFGLASFKRSWDALSPSGTLVCYGSSPSISGGYPDFFAGLIYLGSRKILGRGRRVRVCGTPALIREDAAWYRASLSKIFEWARETALRPILADLIPWDRVSEAQRRLIAGSIKGKLLLDFS
jgi:NADPH:quinone reductase-like Zn-dependent oxidoreductase